MNALLERLVAKYGAAEADEPDDYDVIDGVLVERNMGSESSWIGAELYAVLRDHIRAHRLGWAWHADGGFECFARTRLRYPDIAFVRFGRLPDERVPRGHVTIPPDFAVEIVSPRDRAGELEEKRLDYQDAGVRLVWVIYPEHGLTRVYRPDRTSTEVTADEFLDGEDVIPGFRVRLADLFPRPPELPAAPEPPAA